MENNLKIIKKEFNELKGQHVLINNTVLRFIAIAEDKYDYLYILWDGKNIKYHTICEQIIPLKNKIDEQHYDSIIHTSRYNHLDSFDFMLPNDEEKEIVKKFALKQRKDVIKSIPDDINVLSEFCWDFN
ncbi:hypothetical protein M0Q97_11905 [Candidatus Dojkabacteria bacterium]|jgi:hypothetical protein|nr:hypothetical protein [Candidatus Dojkabacteria bacterium]